VVDIDIASLLAEACSQQPQDKSAPISISGFEEVGSR